ncbi:MAG: hypothetical protein M3Q56_01510 [Bacteroidota bacterium]|nr:hypothetical protein [Bacteroidota bacterium]
MHKNRIIIVLSLLFVCLVLTSSVFAQCPMCKMAAESNLKAGGNAGKGLNQGILYLLALPYLAVSILAFLWWKNKKVLKQS